jgi:hypothetical protein
MLANGEWNASSSEPLLEGKPIDWSVAGGVLLALVLVVSLGALLYFLGQLSAPANTSSMPIPVLQRTRPPAMPQGTLQTAAEARRDAKSTVTESSESTFGSPAYAAPAEAKSAGHPHRRPVLEQQPPPPAGVTAM